MTLSGLGLLLEPGFLSILPALRGLRFSKAALFGEFRLTFRLRLCGKPTGLFVAAAALLFLLTPALFGFTRGLTSSGGGGTGGFLHGLREGGKRLPLRGEERQEFPVAGCFRRTRRLPETNGTLSLLTSTPCLAGTTDRGSGSGNIRMLAGAHEGIARAFHFALQLRDHGSDGGRRTSAGILCFDLRLSFRLGQPTGGFAQAAHCFRRMALAGGGQ